MVPLRHIQLPGLTSYTRASRIQKLGVDHHLKFRAIKRKITPPQVLTFQTPPTYTCGRREVGKLTPEQIEHLRAGGEANFYEAQRGGQTTFHGPGQLTAYIICTLPHHGLKTREFVTLLEQSVIDTCSYYGIAGKCTKDPGVWTENGDKIASVGVHVQRYVTSHGIALNVSPDLKWFDRIVACGLPDKKATSFEREGIKGIELDQVAKTYAHCLSELFEGVEGFHEVRLRSEEDIEHWKRKRSIEKRVEELEALQQKGAEGIEEQLETARKDLAQLMDGENEYETF